jgi:hypothetical protein
VSTTDPSRAARPGNEPAADAPAPAPVDGDLAALFAREGRAHPASPAGQARVWSRLESSLNMGPHDPNGGGGGGGVSAPAASPPRIDLKPSRLMAHLSMAACFVGAAALMWGALTKSDPAMPRAVASPDTFARSPSRVAEIQSASKANTPASQLEGPASISVGALPSAKDVASPARGQREPSGGSGDSEGTCTICDERSILDVARRGLREKHHDVALAAIEEHRTRFAAGQLAEERESLRVHVLVAMGRSSDAELGKAEFRRAFPDSPLLESVERAGAR